MVAALYEAGMTDKVIAEKTGSTQATITRIRNGVHSEPKHKTWAAINQFYLEHCAALAVAQKAGEAGHVAP